MRAGLTRFLLALGLFAFVGSGCDQLAPWWEAVQKDKGIGTSGTGAGGTSGTASMCVRITEGGTGTCEDYATYKIRSADVCAQKNLVISSLEPGAMCGNGGVESMTFVCCPPAPTPTPVTCSESTDATGRACKTCVDANGKTVSTDCNSNVPGMMCVNIDGGGDSTSCKPYDIWKQYGSDTCQQKNMQLTNLLTGPSCGGTNYQNVTYVCCATTPSGSTGTGGSPGGGSGGTGGASGQMCTTNRLSGTGCKSYDLWKQDASATCTQKMLQLTSITPGPACDGGIVGVTFTCCGGPTPSPPPPPTGSGGSSGGQMCTTSEMGGSTSCKPYDLWKQYASDACTQQNLVLTGLATGTTCGDGVYQSIKLTCCAPTPSPPPPKCTQTVDASGQVCKTCVDSVTGAVISNDCAPGSGSGMCVTIDDGSASSCKDEATWKKYGTDRCAQQNLLLTDLKLAVACPGGYSMVTYVCCGSGAP